MSDSLADVIADSRDMYVRYGDFDLPDLEGLITCADLEVLPQDWTRKPPSTAVWVDYGRGARPSA